MIATAGVAFAAFVVWATVVVRTTRSRWCQDLDLHDWRSQPGTAYDACQCGATRLSKP